MSDTIEQVAPEQSVGTSIPGETAPAPAPAEAPERSEAETRARAMGWVDKDSYRGPAEKWVDADTFVQRGEQELPVLRERNRTMARQLTSLEERIQKQEREWQSRIEQFGNMSAMALRQQRENINAQYEAAKLNAVEMADSQRYQQLGRDQRQRLQQFDEQVYEQVYEQQQRQQPPQGPAPADVSKVNAWKVENPWFTADPALNQYAQTVHVHLNQTKPGLSVEENLAEVAKIVRQNFPEKFNRAQGGPPAVEGGNGMAGGKRSKGFSDMPSEDQRVADDFIKAGAYKDRASFAKAYWAMNQ